MLPDPKMGFQPHTEKDFTTMACIKEQTDFTLKVDAALRFAIAQLRFVVAEPRVTSCAATSQGRLPALCSK